MPDLKLGRLPDRTPVRISFKASPDLARSLQVYAELYRETYGRAERVSDLIPYMLESFLASDRAFARSRRDIQAGSDAAHAKAMQAADRSRNESLLAPSTTPKDET